MLARTVFILFAFFFLVQAAGAAVIQLPRTGQTICWDTAGNVVTCAGTGQDGETLIGVEWPSPRFDDNGNGTLTDRLTGLVWLKEANCFGSVPWQKALDSANVLSSGTCGLSDGSLAGAWRLPNRKELMSITNQNVSNGGTWLNSQGFVHGQHTYYWTSDTCLDYGVAYKWIVHPIGAAYPDSWNTPPGSRFVMLVREPAQVTITAAIEGGHGMITSASPLTVPYGSAAAFVLSAEDGYKLNPAVTGSCQPGSFAGYVYDLGRATADCSVSFSFAALTHTINTSTSGDGAIACTPSGAIAYNTDASCTATPATGNHVEKVTVDGVNQTVTDPVSFTYAFPAMVTDHDMFAAFVINSYTVRFLAGNKGTLSGNASQTINHGGSTTAVTALPAAGYHFVNWTGDNGFVTTTANPLTLNNVTGSVTVKANFTRRSRVR